MTLKEKIGHIWYYYKTYIIFGTIIAVALAIALKSCISKHNYDVNILYMTYGYSDDLNQSEELSEFFNKYAEDTNGDGIADTQIISIRYGITTQEITSANAMRSANLAAGKNVLFMLDEQNYNELKNGGFLEDISALGTSEYLNGDRFEIFNSGLLDDISLFREIGDQYYLCLRTYDAKKAESDKNYKQQYDSAKRLLINIINDN